VNLIDPLAPVKKKELLIALAVYVVLSLLVFKDIFTKIYIDINGDSFFSFYSWNAFFRNCIERGIFPLWNPLVLCGHPYHLESVSNFSISNLLLLFFSANAAWNLKLFLSAVLSGWLTFYFLRKQLKLSNIASFLGGVIFMFVMPDTIDASPVFLPLALVVASKWLDNKKFLWQFMLAVVFSLYFFNANPQFVMYLYVFLYAYILSSFIHKEKNISAGRILQNLIIASLPFLIACGLSALRIIPMLEMAHLSHRGSMGTFSFMLLPTHLINLIYPDFYFSSGSQELNFFPDVILNGITAFLFGPERLKFINGPYVGVFVLLLALFTIAKKNKNYNEKFFSYSIFIVLLYVMFNSVLFIVIRYIPFLSKIPFVDRSYIIYKFSIVVLAAISLEGFIKYTQDTERIKKIISFLWRFLAFLILARAVVALVLALFGKNILSFLTTKVLPQIAGKPFYRASSEFYYGRLEQFILFINSWSAPDNLYFILPTVFLVTSLLLLSFYLKNKLHKKFFIFFAIIIIFSDLHYNFKVPAQSYEKVVAPYPSASFIKEQPGIFRVMPMLHLRSNDEKTPLPIYTSTFLRPESNMIYDIMTPEGYRSLYLDRYADIMGLFTEKSADNLKAKLCEFNNIDKNIADFLNVKYLIASPVTADKFSKDYKLVYADNQHRIFLNKDVLPRSFVAHNIVTIKNRKEILEKIASNPDFSKTVILEEDVADFIAPGRETKINSKVSIDKYEPNKVMIRTDTSEEGFLVLLDCYYPGWKAFIDAKPAKIFQADYIFRAVRVPQGKHVINFLYKPDSLRMGFVLSAAFFVLGLILCIVLGNKRKM